MKPFSSLLRAVVPVFAMAFSVSGDAEISRSSESLIPAPGNFPAPRSVAMAGGSPSDTRDQASYEEPRKPRIHPERSHTAAQDLIDLGMRNPPVNGEADNDDRRLQVKTGNREFKFVGSDAAYSLARRPREHFRSAHEPAAAAVAAPAISGNGRTGLWILGGIAAALSTVAVLLCPSATQER